MRESPEGPRARKASPKAKKNTARGQPEKAQPINQSTAKNNFPLNILFFSFSSSTATPIFCQRAEQSRWPWRYKLVKLIANLQPFDTIPGKHVSPPGTASKQPPTTHATPSSSYLIRLFQLIFPPTVLTSEGKVPNQIQAHQQVACSTASRPFTRPRLWNSWPFTTYRLPQLGFHGAALSSPKSHGFWAIAFLFTKM